MRCELRGQQAMLSLVVAGAGIGNIGAEGKHNGIWIGMLLLIFVNPNHPVSTAPAGWSM